jgi:uncharacterized repeat protein (TIGR03803 family)
MNGTVGSDATNLCIFEVVCKWGDEGLVDILRQTGRMLKRFTAGAIMMYLVQHRDWFFGRRLWAAIGALAIVLLPAAVQIQSAQAQTFSVLYNFAGGSDGKTPYAALIEAGGNLYGTTHEGGAFHYGTVFKVDASGAETVLHSFTNTDGAYPWGSLMRDVAGNLYSTTKAGGTFGDGTVFKLDPAGNETVLHNFAGGADGVGPYAGLIRDATNLYGTTYGALPYGDYGTVFKVDRNGTETVLYTFTGGADGGKPSASLVLDAAGNLYGTASIGGTFNGGTVFKVDPSGALTVLHTFMGGTTDGAYPKSGLVLDKNGNLYGTTYSGGAGHSGTVFKLDTSGSLTLLYSFAGGTDGANPIGGLVLGSQGNFYGTTYGGGAANHGTVFKLSANGTETLLHSFNSTDGSDPYAGLVRDAAGNLYGTTQRGGAAGYGTVFKIAP